MVQFAFYGGYATMAVPAALFIRKYSYKVGVLIGLGLPSTSPLSSPSSASSSSPSTATVLLSRPTPHPPFKGGGGYPTRTEMAILRSC